MVEGGCGPCSFVNNAKRICCNGLKPITKNNVLYHYTPLFGAASHIGLAVNVLNPSLVLRMFPKRDVTNFLLLNSLVGTGLYIYSRPHLSSMKSSTDKLKYSVFGAVMFTFGSVLLWAMARSVLPEHTVICTTVGVASSVTLVKLGVDYYSFVDKRCTCDKRGCST